MVHNFTSYLACGDEKKLPSIPLDLCALQFVVFWHCFSSCCIFLSDIVSLTSFDCLKRNTCWYWASLFWRNHPCSPFDFKRDWEVKWFEMKDTAPASLFGLDIKRMSYIIPCNFPKSCNLLLFNWSCIINWSWIKANCQHKVHCILSSKCGGMDSEWALNQTAAFLPEWDWIWKESCHGGKDHVWRVFKILFL